MARMVLVTAAMAAILLGAPIAGSAQASEAAETEAREHFEIARRYYDLGRFLEAAGEFQRAYDLSARPALLLNVYLSYRDAAEPARAAAALREYLRLGEIAPEERAQLEVRLRALERQVEGGAPEPAPDVLAPVILLGSGAAVLLAGVGTGIGALMANTDLEAACPNRRCAVEDAGRIDTVQSLSIATDVLLAVGAAAATAGLIWLMVELTTGTEAPASAHLRCQGLGCEVVGRF